MRSFAILLAVGMALGGCRAVERSSSNPTDQSETAMTDTTPTDTTMGTDTMGDDKHDIHVCHVGRRPGSRSNHNHTADDNLNH
jgi:uncharacterized protein YceK